MDKPNDDNTTKKKPSEWLAAIVAKGKRWYNYAVSGVWSDTRRNWMVNLMKTANLSVRSFLNADLQIRAAALTCQTLLASVPAFALLFAICRGFGFQNLVESQLFQFFPAQSTALTTALKFVDSYLAQSSEGIFVGIGIVFLLWTLISLISNVEVSFNKIWGIPKGRTFWRKITDYTAIFLILPILMICSSGISVFMSKTIQENLPLDFLSPMVSVILDLSSLVLVWLFFAGSYMLVPNTKVKFKNAIAAGILAGTAFVILEWLFVSGQVYVTRYNAIYGSFSFLPLLLIWLQLVWLITLSGAVYCYSSQNISEFSFSNEIARISDDYRWRILIAVMTVTSRRYLDEEEPLTPHRISGQYGLPVSLVTIAVNRLLSAGLLMRVVTDPGNDDFAVAPALNPSTLTLGEVIRRVADNGSKRFIPGFDGKFGSVDASLDDLRHVALDHADKILISTLTINNNIEHENSNRN